ALGRDLPVVRAAASQFPKQAEGFMERDGHLYQVAVTPVYVESVGGRQAVIDVLGAGCGVDGGGARGFEESGGGSEGWFLGARRCSVAGGEGGDCFDAKPGGDGGAAGEYRGVAGGGDQRRGVDVRAVAEAADRRGGEAYWQSVDSAVVRRGAAEDRGAAAGHC